VATASKKDPRLIVPAKRHRCYRGLLLSEQNPAFTPAGAIESVVIDKMRHARRSPEVLRVKDR